jgi:hypothetical protein
VKFGKLLLIFALAVVGFDAIASLASLQFGLSYGLFAFGSAVLYTAIAIYCGLRRGFGAAVLLGALLGLVDATFGWAVSWVIGPGRPVGVDFSWATWLFTAAVVTLLGAIYGLIGGAIGALARRRAGNKQDP